MDLQKNVLSSLVDAREQISIELRKFLNDNTASIETVLSLSDIYGEYDGEIIYLYATYFSQIYQSLTDVQKTQITNLANDIGYIDPTGAFLYSAPVGMPVIDNTDFLFELRKLKV